MFCTLVVTVRFTCSMVVCNSPSLCFFSLSKCLFWSKNHCEHKHFNWLNMLTECCRMTRKERQKRHLVPTNWKTYIVMYNPHIELLLSPLCMAVFAPPHWTQVVGPAAAPYRGRKWGQKHDCIVYYCKEKETCAKSACSNVNGMTTVTIKKKNKPKTKGPVCVYVSYVCELWGEFGWRTVGEKGCLDKAK